jgi:hypothetical protein
MAAGSMGNKGSNLAGSGLSAFSGARIPFSDIPLVALSAAEAQLVCVYILTCRSD